jgi:hypothetical protein
MINAYTSWVNHMKDTGNIESIMLKWILGEYGVKVAIGLNWLKTEPILDFCEQINKISRFFKA